MTALHHQPAGLTTGLRFDSERCGVKGFAHGGYACGALAEVIDPSPAKSIVATLLRPMPLDTALHIARIGHRTALMSPDDSSSNSVPYAIAAPSPRVGVPFTAERRRKVRQSSQFSPEREHPQPLCFACGPLSPSRQALRLHPRGVDNDWSIATWTPGREICGGSDHVIAPFVWATLDCTGGRAVEADDRLRVLQRMSATVDELPVLGAEYVLLAHSESTVGRLTTVHATLETAEGTCIAAARSVWIDVETAWEDLV